MAFYLDSFAVVKLVIHERETPVLLKWCGQPDRTLVSSDLTRTELLRAIRRLDVGRTDDARLVLTSVTLLTVTAEVFDRAGLLEPPMLRSLDAIHVASALSLGTDLEGFVTYDDRLADAARANGIAVLAPGA